LRLNSVASIPATEGWDSQLPMMTSEAKSNTRDGWSAKARSSRTEEVVANVYGWGEISSNNRYVVCAYGRSIRTADRSSDVAVRVNSRLASSSRRRFRARSSPTGNAGLSESISRPCCVHAQMPFSTPRRWSGDRVASNRGPPEAAAVMWAAVPSERDPSGLIPGPLVDFSQTEHLCPARAASARLTSREKSSLCFIRSTWRL
jgi:hypothetical protein